MSDPFLMEYETERILRGLQLAMQATGAGRGTICLKGKHSQAMASMKKLAGSQPFRDVDVVELGDFYPAGDEHVLVYDVMKRVVPEGGIPLQVGVVVNNVESLFNVAQAVDDDKPVIEKYLTVGGEVGKPCVMKAAVGTPVSHVIEQAGGATLNGFKVLLGGPMMGQVVSDLSAPVTKTTSAVIVFPPEHNVIVGKITDPGRVRHITKVVCCQCSRCTDLCPRRLLGHSLEPHKIMRQLGSPSGLSQEIMADALICSECGICEKYACPMMISPREVNAQIKQELLKKGVKRPSKQEDYRPSPFRDVRKIPTRRLIDRIQIRDYDVHPEFLGAAATAGEVTIPLKQHVGAPAKPVVQAGDRVGRGDLIGEIPENALGARVHASIGGVVASVDDTVRIQQ
jgi:Na+-translocating ferredoxin:NAD+ oxidoreductase RnfC subunit